MSNDTETVNADISHNGRRTNLGDKAMEAFVLAAIRAVVDNKASKIDISVPTPSGDGSMIVTVRLV